MVVNVLFILCEDHVLALLCPYSCAVNQTWLQIVLLPWIILGTSHNTMRIIQVCYYEIQHLKVSRVWSTLLVYSSRIWWRHVVTQYRWIPRSGVDWIMLCVCMQYFPFSCRRVWQWVHVLCSRWQATTSTLINSSWSPLHSPPNSCAQPQENTHPRCQHTQMPF